ncbi:MULTISPECIES: hypothetical protein [Rhodovulum]|uniref:hypothetical protein n=1 Tax=Rhodovulum TaxID=34008 RepID=UPI001FEA3DCF|nr:MULTISPECIES: hypothetical protein [Rhodovulum]
MKIAEIRPHLLHQRLDSGFESAFSTFRDRWACLVEIVCEDGPPAGARRSAPPAPMPP